MTEFDDTAADVITVDTGAEMATLLEDMKTLVGDNIKGFEVRYKESSWSSKVLGLLTRPFCPEYMTRFTTTRYPRVYFPSEEFVQDPRQPKRASKILAHEYVHLWDTKEEGIRHQLGYASPQLWAAGFFLLFLVGAILWRPGIWWLAPMLLGVFCVPYALLVTNKKAGKILWIVTGIIGLLAFFALAIWKAQWWSLLLLGAIMCAVPLPSYWRMLAEIRGYSMSMAFNFWRYGSVRQNTKDWIVECFTGPNYYFMWPWKAAMKRRVEDMVNRLELGTVFDAPVFGGSCKPFEHVYNLLNQHGLVKR